VQGGERRQASFYDGPRDASMAQVTVDAALASIGILNVLTGCGGLAANEANIAREASPRADPASKLGDNAS
jgi:hypothetical protein